MTDTDTTDTTAAPDAPGGQDTLFEIETPPPVSLYDRFVVPPFSILDRRQGPWMERRSRWLSLGIQSELGRDGFHTYSEDWAKNPDFAGYGKLAKISVFDPVLCEVAYRWFSPDGGRVLDPFAGGSVRGVVASVLLRDYLGIDLRPEQVAANQEQAGLGTPTLPPRWLQGDSDEVLDELAAGGYEADLVFSCPPYADLEVYSDHPADLSNMTPDAFTAAYYSIIRKAAALLRQDRFAVWVISDVRDKKSGAYRGIVMNTIDAFAAAGLALYNDLIILDPVGTGAVRSGPAFEATRKVTRMHQHFLVFVKGDPKAAAVAVGAGRARKGKPTPGEVPPPPLPDPDAAALAEYEADLGVPDDIPDYDEEEGPLW